MNGEDRPLESGVGREPGGGKNPEGFGNAAGIRLALGHHWISLGWADELFRLGEALPKIIGRLPTKTKLLFTQGLEDPVCPPETGRWLFEQLPMKNKRWVGIPGARHECFADQFAPLLRREVRLWLVEEAGE